MDTSNSLNELFNSEGSASGRDPDGTDAEAPAWELIDAGRYRPRRIRGSCRGRELG